MALFGLKKNTEKVNTDKAVTKAKKPKTTKKVEKVVAERVVSTSNTNNDVVIRPRITEKAGMMAESGVYTFEVIKNSNKNQISNAIKSIYKVNPLKIRIINLKDKQVFVKGKKGNKSGVKKALVYLKKGDKIEIA